MLATQDINTKKFPAFSSPSKDRESEVNFRKVSNTRQYPKTQTTVEGFEFSPREIVASSENLGWQNIQAFLIRHERTEVRANSPRLHCLVLQLGDPLEIEVTVGGRTTRQILHTGELLIFPAGWAVRLDWREEKVNEALYFFLDPAFLQAIAEDLDIAGQIAIEPAIGIDDEQLRYLALSLLCDMKDSNIFGDFYAEQLGRALGLQLIRRYGHFREINLKQGGMAPFKLRKALEFINNNLEYEQDVSLDKVAGCVGMSYFHFSRTFKQSMGISPNNYIVSRRIENAKKLLANSNSPIADIALQVGFASQSHFTTMFRRLTGRTPKIFRRASLNVGLSPAGAY